MAWKYSGPIAKPKPETARKINLGAFVSGICLLCLLPVLANPTTVSPLLAFLGFIGFITFPFLGIAVLVLNTSRFGFPKKK